MKIMFYTSSLGKGGAERVISILSNKMVEKHDISILVNTLENKAYEIDGNVKLLQLDQKNINSNLIRNINRLKTTNQIIKKEKPNIIISFLPMPSYRILMLKNNFKGIPIIVADRNDPKEEYASLINKILMKILYKRANGFVFQTKEQQEYFSKNIVKKSTIIFNPIKDEFLEKRELEKEDTIINVGRLVEQKQQKLLINAFSKISYKYPNYTLKIFGEGPLKADLQNQINNLNLQNQIKLCGISDNIKQELEKAKLFVLSSRYEGMPNSLIEAMSVGLPVISTDCPCGGPRELIDNGINGVLVSVDNQEELQEKIEKILKDHKFAQNIGTEAQKIKQKLNKEEIIAQWENYITEIYRSRKEGIK